MVCEIIKVLENEDISLNTAPRSSKAVVDNFEKALAVFKNKHPEIPNSLINSPENMIENIEIVYAFIYSLISIYPNASPVDYQDSPLPYGPIGIRKLEVSITTWITSLNILHPAPEMFQELIPELKSGVLLCVLVSRVFSVKFQNITKDPKSDPSAMNNIRKALDVLRKIPHMSQKYVWCGKEILKGSYGVILGLLEDIHRCADGLQMRKSGNDYHKDGPYLGKKKETRFKTFQEESFNATFGSVVSPKKEEKYEEVDSYKQWINSLGVVFPRSISFNDEHIPEFTTGTLFCNIISAVEKINIPGIDKEPRSKASAMQNITKALNVVKKKPNFPHELKNCEEGIFLGNGGIIRKLLQALMKIYKNKTI